MQRHLATQLLSYRATVLAAALLVSACGSSSSPPAIQLTDNAIEVSGVSRNTLNAIENADLDDERWRSVFRVGVSPEAPAILGSYTVAGSVIRFSPAFPLDAGRQYHARFDPSPIAGSSDRDAVSAVVARPGANAVPSVTVTNLYPTSAEIPANLLRMYIEFSGPMGRRSGIEHITLLNDRGEEVPGAVLPLDYEFWSPDHRRFTVFFDPGRVKRGILPNREMGRAFTEGHTATLVVSREWTDAQGQPLKEDFRRTFRVAAAIEEPLKPSAWKIAAPAKGGRQPLVVTFPRPLDHGLLMRALGVRKDGAVVEGDVEVSAGETRWSFTPREPWGAGTHNLLALDILEDVAGNQIGRAFEVDNFDTVDKSPDAQSLLVPFEVR